MKALFAACSQLTRGVSGFSATIQEDLVSISFTGTILPSPRSRADNAARTPGDLRAHILRHRALFDAPRAGAREIPEMRGLGERPSS